MSHDLMVFNFATAPAGRKAFMQWHDQQTEWADGYSHDDPARCTLGLRAWYMEMIQRLPPMGGPLAVRGLASLMSPTTAWARTSSTPPSPEASARRLATPRSAWRRSAASASTT